MLFSSVPQNIPPKRKKYEHHNGINGSQNGNRGDVEPETNSSPRLNGDICSNGDVSSTNGCASAAEVRAACETNGSASISVDECMSLVMTCDEEPTKCEPMSNDETGSHKLSNGDVNGKASPAHSSNGVGCSASDSVPVRRSNRSRRGKKIVEITVSSSLTLKEVKKKVSQ